MNNMKLKNDQIVQSKALWGVRGLKRDSQRNRLLEHIRAKLVCIAVNKFSQ